MLLPASRLRLQSEVMSSKKAAVGIDDWKLPIFNRHLDEAGYKYESPRRLVNGALVLIVEYEWVHKLQLIVEAAQRECAVLARLRPKPASAQGVIDDPGTDKDRQ